MSEPLSGLDAAARPCGNIQSGVPSDEFDKGDGDPPATQATTGSKEAEVEITDEVQRPTTTADQDPSELYELANSILSECKQAAQVSDIDTAILLLREAYSRQSGSLNDLAGALVVRFWHLGKAVDLQEAFELWKDGAQSVSCDNEHQSLEDPALQHHEVIPNEGQDALEITQFANCTLEEFHQVAEISSLDTAIFLHREALRLRPGPHVESSASLNGLALALGARFYQTGQLRDLDEAIVRHQEALAQIPESHPDRRVLLTNLFAALLTRYGKTAQLHDLQDAFFLNSEALGLDRTDSGTTEDKPKHSLQRLVTQLEEVGITSDEVSDLFTAANDLHRQFKLTGQLSDLETAISFYEEILSCLPMQDRSLPMYLTNIACMLHERFNYAGQPSDLVLSVQLHQEALSLLPVHHAGRPGSLHNFANALCTRFEEMGDIDDVERMIALYREALELLPDAQPTRCMPLNGLASALMMRFDQTGQIKDVDEAISLGREALGLQPAPHPSHSQSLNNLANALNVRFHQKGDIEDVNEAITLHQKALKLFPAAHPTRSTWAIGKSRALPCMAVHALPCNSDYRALPCMM